MKLNKVKTALHPKSGVNQFIVFRNYWNIPGWVKETPVETREVESEVRGKE